MSDKPVTEERIQPVDMAAVLFLFLCKILFTDEMCYSIMEMLKIGGLGWNYGIK